MKSATQFLPIIISAIFCCVIVQIGYSLGNDLIQYLGGLVFVITCLGFVGYSVAKNRSN